MNAARVVRADERLSGMDLPLMEVCHRVALRSIDCLVVSAGFEDRSTVVLKAALECGRRFSVIVLEYRPFLEENRLSEIEALCSNAGCAWQRLIYDRLEPAGFGALLAEAIAGIGGRVYLDVSAMSRLGIVQALVALKGRSGSFKNVSVLYTEAAEYPPSREEYQAAIKRCEVEPLSSLLLLSSGVFDITIVPELSSLGMVSEQTLLIAFPTFSCDQLTALRSELAPWKVVCIHGKPPALENQWRMDAIALINGIGAIGNMDSVSSTLDYRETLRCVLDLYRVYGDRERILISPTGSKMQSVAIGLIRAFMEDLQIVYPTPNEFSAPRNYTRGQGAMYSLQLDSFALVEGT